MTDGLGNRFLEIDRNIAVNLRTYRESGSIGQEELAPRMSRTREAGLRGCEADLAVTDPHTYWLGTKAEKYSSTPASSSARRYRTWFR